MGEENGISHIFKGTLTQLFAAIFGTLFAISDGMVTGWTAPMIPYLISEDSHIKTTKHEAEWLEPALLLGAACGLPTTIFFTQKIGRKKSLLLASVVELFTWIIVAFADRILFICMARFLSGMAGNMVFVAAPMYVAEIADQKIRGFLSSIIYLMLLFGCLVVYIVGPYFPYYTSAIIGAGIVLTELAVFSSVPESPYYLLWKGQPEKAKKSLEYFRPGVSVEEELKAIEEAIERQKSEKGKIRDLLSGGNRKALIIMSALAGGQNLCAMNVVLMNLHLILREAGSVYLSESLTAIIFSSIMLTAATIASFQVDKYGRRIILVTSSILTGICLLNSNLF
uniref:Facilitated trehalose transporter Tret1 n=1 Tax=Anoplophora glabripennis TaxID=217634 RepID=V5GXE1_ANOGL